MVQKKKTRGFSFQKFHLEQDQSAQKICTEACIFGALLAQRIDSASLLDLGSGTGLLSMMIAQKNPQSRILGIEIDDKSFQQSISNLRDYKLPHRIDFIREDIALWSPDQPYDWIVSNPPFFEASLASPSTYRNRARQVESFSPRVFLDLLKRLDFQPQIALLLAPNRIHEEYTDLLHQAGWHFYEQINICDRKYKKPGTLMCFFNREQRSFKSWDFIIKNENQEYSQEMKNLLKDYYLAFK